MNLLRWSYSAVSWLFSLHISECVLCAMQFGGVATRWNGRTVGTQNISSLAHSEAGSLPAGSSLPVVRHAQDDGQRRHVLRATRSLHIHFQVFKRYISLQLCKVETCCASVHSTQWVGIKYSIPVDRTPSRKFSYTTAAMGCSLVLFVLFVSILGMHLFGGKFCALKTDSERQCNCTEVMAGLCECSRKNFDSLLWAIVTVFQVCCICRQ